MSIKLVQLVSELSAIDPEMEAKFIVNGEERDFEIVTTEEGLEIRIETTDKDENEKSVPDEIPQPTPQPKKRECGMSTTSIYSS